MISCFSSLVYMPESTIARLNGNSMFNFLRNIHTIFHRDCRSFYNPIQFSSVAQSCLTLCNAMSSLSITSSQSSLKFMFIEWVMLSNHLILCCPLLLLLSTFPSIRIFSHESVLCIRWPKYLFELQLQHQSFQ